MKRFFLSLSLISAISTSAIGAPITTVEGLEQSEGLMSCSTEALAIGLAKAWVVGGYEAGDEFVIAHGDQCSSIPPREALVYSIDLSTVHDGIARLDAPTLGLAPGTVLWMPFKQVTNDLYSKFDREPGAATDLLDLEVYTPMDGLYVSRGVVNREVGALQFVYLHGGAVDLLWYDPQNHKILAVQDSPKSTYDPATNQLILEQPGATKLLNYTLDGERLRTRDKPEMGKFVSEPTLTRFNNDMLLGLFPASLEHKMTRHMRLFIIGANSSLHQ